MPRISSICSRMCRRIDGIADHRFSSTHVHTMKPGTSQASDARIPESRDVEALSRLVTHMQNTLEAERSALAKELHDELGGLITAAKMDMRGCRPGSAARSIPESA